MDISGFDLAIFAVLLSYTYIQYKTIPAKVYKDQQRVFDVKMESGHFQARAGSRPPEAAVSWLVGRGRSR